MFLLTTTGNTSSVTFNDLGERTFIHPTINFDLESEYNIFKLTRSTYIQSAINLNYITIKDDLNNTINNLSKFFMQTNVYDSDGDNIVDNTNMLAGSSASIYLDSANLTGTINSNVLVGSGVVESINGLTGSVNIATYSINNQYVINYLTDLPTATGGKITLLAGKEYLFSSPINIGTNHLELGNGTTLSSINNLLTPITYTGTGAAIRGTNISCTLREIKVDGAEQGFSFIGTGSEAISIHHSSFANCTKIGTVDVVYYFNYANNNHKGNLDGITFNHASTTSNGIYLIRSNNFSDTNTGTFIKSVSGNFEDIRLSNNNLDIPIGNVGFDLNESGMNVVEKVSLTNNILTGKSITKTLNFNPLDGKIESIGNIGIKNNVSNENVTTTEMFNISNIRVGMILFNTTLNSLVYWDGFKWDKLSDTQIFKEQLVENFETGIGSFKLVNGGENDWNRGTVLPKDGTYSLYISNDGGISNTYSSNGSSLDVSHAYIDILLPPAISNLALSFDWQCEGEVNYDYMKIFDTTTSVTPVANTELVSGQIGLSQYNNQLSFANAQIPLPIAEANTTRRFIFSWRNDSSVQNQPPGKIDNIKIVYL